MFEMYKSAVVELLDLIIVFVEPLVELLVALLAALLVELLVALLVALLVVKWVAVLELQALVHCSVEDKLSFTNFLYQS